MRVKLNVVCTCAVECCTCAIVDTAGKLVCVYKKSYSSYAHKKYVNEKHLAKNILLIENENLL